jgi:hypothetical protein
VPTAQRRLPAIVASRLPGDRPRRDAGSVILRPLAADERDPGDGAVERTALHDRIESAQLRQRIFGTTALDGLAAILRWAAAERTASVSAEVQPARADRPPSWGVDMPGRADFNCRPLSIRWRNPS